MGLLLWFKSPHKIVSGIGIAVGGAIVLAAMSDVWDARMSTIANYEQDGSAQGRINAWWMAWNLAKDNFMGGGFDIYNLANFSRYAPNPTDVHAAHSIYFQVLGEHGFVGLAIYLIMWLLVWRSANWLIRESGKSEETRWCRNLAAMCQVSLVGYAVGGAFLSLAYFDLPYDVLAMVVLTKRWLQEHWKSATAVSSVGARRNRRVNRTRRARVMTADAGASMSGRARPYAVLPVGGVSGGRRGASAARRAMFGAGTAEAEIARIVLRALSPAGHQGRLSVFIFHRVLAAGDPVLPSEPDAAQFDRIVRFISRAFNLLSLGDAVARLANQTLPAAAATITFDDGYLDNYTVALPILRRYKAPATIFVATGFLDGGRMWNDDIIEAVRSAPGPTLDWSRYGLGIYDVQSTDARVRCYSDVLGRLKYVEHAQRANRAREIATNAGVPEASDIDDEWYADTCVAIGRHRDRSTHAHASHSEFARR